MSSKQDKIRKEKLEKVERLIDNLKYQADSHPAVRYKMRPLIERAECIRAGLLSLLGPSEVWR